MADLFLDSLTYGAHSTATDALAGGLPILTLTGTVVLHGGSMLGGCGGYNAQGRRVVLVLVGDKKCRGTVDTEQENNSCKVFFDPFLLPILSFFDDRHVFQQPTEK